MKNKLPKLKVVFNGDVYTTKEVKHFEELSRDTEAFAMTLYKNGEKFADVSNDGWGDEDFFFCHKPFQLTIDEEDVLSCEVVWKLFCINMERNFIKKNQRAALCFKKYRKVSFGETEVDEPIFSSLPIMIGKKKSNIGELEKTPKGHAFIMATIKKYLNKGYIFINTNVEVD